VIQGIPKKLKYEISIKPLSVRPSRSFGVSRITLNGVEYYQPECHCEPGMGHICYLRPVPQVIDIPIEKILEQIDKPSGNAAQSRFM
jgi:hypothetical protein